MLVNLWEMRPDWTFDCYENGVQTSGRLTPWRATTPSTAISATRADRMAALFVVRDGPHGRPLAAIRPREPRAAIRITVTDQKGAPLHVIDTKIE